MTVEKLMQMLTRFPQNAEVVVPSQDDPSANRMLAGADLLQAETDGTLFWPAGADITCPVAVVRLH